MKVRLPPMKNHMHFRKQSDGHSWLVFTRPATGGRRSIAIIHIPDPHRDPTIEWLPGIEHAEHPQVEKLASEIRRKRLTFETKQSSAPASVSAALPSDAPASEPEAVRELILCEGETEQRYFEALCGFLGLKDRIDVKVSPAKEPCLVLRNLAKDMLLARQINEVEYGQAWLVFDRDSHLTFHDAVELGKKIPFIHLAFTNPCFEYWLLLHFEQFDGTLFFDQQIVIEHVQREETLSPSFKRVVTEEIIEKIVSPDNCLCALKTFYPEYEKNASHINAFGRHTSFACKRAKAMTGPHAGLGSSLPDLITHLCQLAAKPLDTAFDALPRIINDRDSARMAEFHKALSRLAVAATEILKAKLKRPENVQNLPINLQMRCRQCKDFVGTLFPGAMFAPTSESQPGDLSSHLHTIIGMQHNLANKVMPKEQAFQKFYTALDTFERWLKEQHLN